MPNATKTTKKQPADRAYGLTTSRDTQEDLTLPSGGFVRARRPGLQGLIKAGIVDDLDTLTGIVATETIPAAEGRPAAKSKAPSGEQVLSALRVMDAVTVHVLVQPPCEPEPDDDGDRLDGVVYVDEVDVEDKTFLVQFAMGGTRDVETFRAQSEAAVGSPTAR